MEKKEAAVSDRGQSTEQANVVSGVTEVFVDPVIERRARRKFDVTVLPLIIILMIMAALDRSNIGNAHVMGLDASVRLVGTEFNTISTVFYPTYIVFELPWVVAIKRYGINRALAVGMVGWSAVTLGTGFVQNYGQLVVVRVLLGVFEAGMLPGLVFAISTIWPPLAQAKRVSAIYVAGTISGAFGGMVAYGVQTMGTRDSLPAWRWLFIIEGIVSFAISALTLVVMPHSAERAWFLTGEEKETLAACRRRDVAYRGEHTFSWRAVRTAVADPLVYLGGVALFANSAATLGFSIFLPTIIKGMGYTNMQANYLTVPVYIWVGVVVVLTSALSDRLKGRAVVLIFLPLAPIVGYAMVVGRANKALGYFAMFLCGSGMFSYNSIMLTWISANIAPDEKRSVGIPIMIGVSGISGVLASQLYDMSQYPRYVQGNSISLGLEFFSLCMVAVIYLLLRARNAKKDRQRTQDAPTTEDPGYGDKALGFEYTL